MFSVVTNRDVVPPFLSGTLDPRPFGNNGGVGKEDFLKGRSLLLSVEFPDRPALHALIDNLAYMLSVRYEPKPSDQARNTVAWLLQSSEPLAAAAYRESSISKYDERISQLQNHDATIALFEKALEDPGWPSTDDAAVPQVFETQVPQRPITKTGWYTGFLMEPVELACNEEIVQSEDTDLDEESNM